MQCNDLVEKKLNPEKSDRKLPALKGMSAEVWNRGYLSFRKKIAHSNILSLMRGFKVLFSIRSTSIPCIALKKFTSQRVGDNSDKGDRYDICQHTDKNFNKLFFTKSVCAHFIYFITQNH